MLVVGIASWLEESQTQSATQHKSPMAKTRTTVTNDQIREQLLEAGAINLRKFGYPDCTAENIMSSMVFRAFFKGMLEDNKGKSPTVDEVIQELLTEIDNGKD